MPRTTLARIPAGMVLAGLLAFFVGCVPPPPPPAAARANMQRQHGDEDEYDSWLYKRMTGRSKASGAVRGLLRSV